METVNKRHGKMYRGKGLPYGTLANASYELHKAYYYHGYKEDWMMPELPCPLDEDKEYVDPEEEMHKKDTAKVIGEMLDNLTPRESKILKMRFGIELDQDYTLEEVGNFFDVTRERIRQIEAKAIRKVKHPSRSDLLRQLIGYYQTTADKKAEEESLRKQWEKERARAEERRKADEEARKVRDRIIFSHRRKVEEAIYKEDLELREKWKDIKPMVSDVEWVAHLEKADPEMYQELKYMVGDIWGKNARIIWEMYAEKK